MPYRLSTVLVKRIKLNLNTDEDPDDDTYVEVRAATQAEQEARAELTAESTRVLRPSETSKTSIEITQRWTFEEQMREEVFLCLCGCNIEDVTEAGKEPRPLFRFRRYDNKMKLDMTREEFSRVWGDLPQSVATAIHNAVLEVNPQWNPKST